MRLEIQHEERPCMVLEDGKERRGLFHGWFVSAWTHGESALIGGFSSGQETQLLAVVERESGAIDLCPVKRVRFLDSAERLDEYIFEERGER